MHVSTHTHLCKQFPSPPTLNIAAVAFKFVSLHSTVARYKDKAVRFIVLLEIFHKLLRQWSLVPRLSRTKAGFFTYADRITDLSAL